ncbi:C39 family peptidase [Dactylosporangium siamense]|uniref:Peptidase C39-like domain-containing protein n=1 Tax=Dactylosporangium siamense TaxID=685454 RepID=A0A919U9X0_9ACTN|nr:C39 family peptidase [Dactylosporangium siamense]GIG47367.1 hypothetical protein Dsi01nite_054080 [Dactylosporangium siamense]
MHRALGRIRGSRIAAVGVAITLAVAGLASPAAAQDGATTMSDAQEEAYKAAHDTDPHTPLSAADKKAAKIKEAAAAKHQKDKLAAAGAQKASSVSPMNSIGANNLSIVQQPQQTNYWCGPAMVSAMLNAKGVSFSQSQAASMMKTTQADGTAWSGINANVPSPTGYPVRDTLNYKLNTSFYVPHGYGSATSTEKTNWRSNVAHDIDNGYPIAGDAYEVVGGKHLAGHPNSNIFHWFAVFGYANYGATTNYIDSVSGATSVSWYASVKAYNYDFNSDNLVSIMSGRGYIW